MNEELYEIMVGQIFIASENFKKDAELPRNVKYDELFISLYYILYLAMCSSIPNADLHARNMAKVFLAWVSDYLNHDEKQAEKYFYLFKRRFSEYTKAYNANHPNLNPLYWLTKEIIKNVYPKKEKDLFYHALFAGALVQHVKTFKLMLKKINPDA